MDKTLVSAGVKCYINGRDIGWVTGVSFESNTPRRAIGGIDTLKPFEIVATAANVTGTISVVKMLGDESLEYHGITSGFNKLNIERYFTLMLVQRTSAGASYTLFRAEECSVERQVWQIQPKQIVVGTFSFQGIEWNNDVTKTELQDT